MERNSSAWGRKTAHRSVASSDQSSLGSCRRDGVPDSQLTMEPLESRSLLSGYALSLLAPMNGTNGAYPMSGMVMDQAGNLFGMSAAGGTASTGSIFKIPAGGSTATLVASFNTTNGSYPYGSLTLDANGNIFGVANSGGDTADDPEGYGFGTVFELPKESGTIIPLATFNGTNGAGPYGGVLVDSSGNVFGTTWAGGTSNHGVIFKVAAGSGTVATLASFAGGAQGANPIGILHLDADGNLFGTTYHGGDVADDPQGAGFGTIFELPKGANSINVLATFNKTNGANPVAGIVADSSGNLYGVASAGGTAGDGTVFELPGGSGTIVKLADFTGANGAAPYGDLVIDANGNLFGTTLQGGDANGDGVVFEVVAGSNTITAIALLPGGNGSSNPFAGLVLDANGNLFGTTEYGGGASGDQYGRGLGSVFEVSPVGPPAQLAFVSQPALTSAGEHVRPAVTVAIEDANGHLVDTDTSYVTIALGGSPSMALTGTLTVQAVGGIATFTDLSIADAGTYTLTASDGSLTSAASASFDITSARFTVAGNGMLIANGDTSAAVTDLTDFGQAPVNHINGQVKRTYTITNIASSEVDLTGATPITITGNNATDFTVSAQPSSTIAGQASVTFTVTFTPSAPGVETAQVNIASSDSTQDPFTFDIQGIGLATADGSDGLQVATIQAGAGNGAVKGQALSVLYTGSLLNGTVFDASSLHGNTPFTLTLGAGQVITGWDEGLVGMKVGETRTLIIPSTLGYGSSAQSKIPANSTLVFQVQLLSISGPQLGVAGSGHAIASGDSAPGAADGTDFGTAALSDSVTHTFSLSNLSSSGTLYLGSTSPVQITGSGADQFTLTQPTLSLQTGTFNITYKPTKNEASTATVTIASNDPTYPSYTFTITGAAPADLSGTFASSLSVPADLSPGVGFTIPVTLANSGPAAAAGTVGIIVQASPDGMWNSSNPTLATSASIAINLAANGSQTINLSALVPPSAVLPAGSYQLLAMIQPESVYDSSLGNNVVSQKSGAAVPLNVVAYNILDSAVTGTWALQAVHSAGSVTADGQGNITSCNLTQGDGTQVQNTGSYRVQAGGVLSAQIGNGGVSYDGSGVISTTGDLALEAYASLPNSAGSDAGMALLVKHSGSFSLADAAGTWDITGEHVRGTAKLAVVNGVGRITGGNIVTDSGTQTITGGTYTVSASGTVTLSPTTNAPANSQPAPLLGTLNDSKDIIAMNDANLGHQPSYRAGDDANLVLLVKNAASFSNASAAGTWTIATLDSRGTLTLDGAGHVSGSITDASATAWSLTGTYSITAKGIVNLAVTQKLVSNGTTKSFTAVGAINNSANAIAVRSVSFAGGDGQNLVVMVRPTSNIATVDSLTSNGPAIRGDKLTLTAHDADIPVGKIAQVLFYLDKNGNGTYDPTVDKLVGRGTRTTGTNDWNYAYSTSGSALGSSHFLAVAVDSFGHKSNFATAQATINDRPAVVTGLTLTPAMPTAGNPLRLRATGISDPDGRVVTINYYWDQNNTGDPASSVSLGSTTAAQAWALSLAQAPANLPATGNVKFLVQAIDNDGLTTIYAHTVAVNARPTIGSLVGSPNPVGRLGNLTLTANNVVDADGGITRVRFYYDKDGSGTFDPKKDLLLGSATKPATGSTIYALTVKAPANLGSNGYFAVALDNRGTSGVSAPTTVTIQNAPPTVGGLAILTRHVAADNPLKLQATGVADMDGKVASVNFYWDQNKTGDPTKSVLLGSATLAQGWILSLAKAPAQLPVGQETFLVQAVDNDGGLSAVKSMTETVVDRPSIAAIVATPNPLSRSAPAVVTVQNVTDTFAAVRSVQLWIAPAGAAFGAASCVLLGSGIASGADWNLALTQARVHVQTPGNYTIFARALDANGILSEVLSVNLSVI